MHFIRISSRRLPSTAARYARPQALRHRFAAGRRSYASAADAVKTASGDMPWLLAAAAVTIPGVYFALQPSASAGHGEHDDHGGHASEGEEHHDEDSNEDSNEEKKEEDSDSGEQSGKSEKAEEDKADDKKEGSDEGKEDSDEGKEKSDEGGDDAKDESDSGKKKAPKMDGINFAGGTSKTESDAKGGTKKRIDSDAAKTIGEGASSGEGDDMSNKQRGYSNTDTKHSTDPSKDPGMSKKGEGTADTAKVKGTVDGNRKQV